MRSIIDGDGLRTPSRDIAACATALVAGILIFASPEIGIAGAITGVVCGGVSAVLFHLPRLRIVKVNATRRRDPSRN